MNEVSEKMPASGIMKRILFIALIAAFVGIIVWVIISGIIKGNEPTKIPDREYNEAEVSLAARELIEKSVLINEIFWYDGIPTTDDRDGLALKSYDRADKGYLESNGIKTLEDIKNLTRGVFSTQQSEYLFNIFLTGGIDEAFTGIAHYIPETITDAETGKREEVGILVSRKRAVERIVAIGEKTEFNYDSIKVICSEGERVKIEVECTVTTSSGEVQTRTQNMYLIEEDDGWRLDTFTKMTYLTQIN